jgi:alpha-glucosidase (family GH31 glycosyl hydrolase)
MFRFRLSKLDSLKFPDKYEISFLNGHFDPWEKVNCNFSENEEVARIETDKIVINIDKNNLDWIIKDKDGSQIYPSDGEVFGMFKDGYTVFDNASAFEETNLNSRYTHWFYNPSTGSYTDIFLEDDLIKDNYFIYGPDYKSLFLQFNQLVGPEPILPRKGYGFFQTQHLPCDANQDEFMEVAHEFRRRDIPCDNLIIDFGWGDACDGDKEVVWGSRMDWSSNYLYPLSPKEMIDSLLGMNYNTMLIHHNAPDHPNRVNHGWTETLVEESLWWKKYKEKLDLGIAGTWQDTRRNNITDAEIWNGTQKYIGANRRVMFMGCRRMQETNPWGGEYTQLPVNAMIGSRRYPFHWVGDSDFTWSEMKWQINAITNTHGSMKGMSYLTWDVYGKTPLIQARMNQFVDFLGVSRSHNLKPWSVSSDIDSWKSRIVIERDLKTTDNTSNADRIAVDGEFTAEKSIRRHRKLRYRLLPYIYSLAYENYLTGMPICRPMMVQYQDDLACCDNQWPYQYMFGNSLLVAPVYHELNSHSVYLPKGQNWIDYWTKETFEGDQVIQYNTTNCEQLPLLVAEGSILVYGKERNWIIPNEQEDTLWIEIYPGKDGHTDIYEDDGYSIRYQQGEYSKTTISHKMGSNGELIVAISEANGNYQGKQSNRIWKVRVMDEADKYTSATCNGKIYEWQNASDLEVTGLANESLFKEISLDLRRDKNVTLVFNQE